MYVFSITSKHIKCLICMIILKLLKRLKTFHVYDYLNNRNVSKHFICMIVAKLFYCCKLEQDWCKFPEDGSYTETCWSKLMTKIHNI